MLNLAKVIKNIKSYFKLQRGDVVSKILVLFDLYCFKLESEPLWNRQCQKWRFLKEDGLRWVLRKAMSEMTVPERGWFALGFEKGSVRNDSSWKRIVCDGLWERQCQKWQFLKEDLGRWKDTVWEGHSWK